MREKLRTLRFTLFLIVVLSGCRAAAPEAPSQGTFAWRTLHDPALGVSIRYPGAYAVDRSHGDVAVRYDGTPVRLVHATDSEARRRGL